MTAGETPEYEQTFILPAGTTNLQHSIDILVGNRAEVYLNGELIRTMVGKTFPATSLTAMSGFNAGETNTLTFVVEATAGEVTGFDVSGELKGVVTETNTTVTS